MLEVKEPPKWEHKTKPRTGVREYTLEISKETFWKLFVLTKGKNAANRDEPEKLTVSGQAETILRGWLEANYPNLDKFWEDYNAAEDQAIIAVQSMQA